MDKDTFIEKFMNKNLNDIIKTYKKYFYEASTDWENRRADRLVLEDKYRNFSGHIDFVELHVPYTKYGHVFEMMKRASKLKGKKLLVLIGDSLNLDMFGPFYQTSDNTLPSIEWANLIRLLKIADKVYDRMVFLQSNHDDRIFKCIVRNLPGRDRATEMIKMVITYQEAFEREGFTSIEVVKGPIFQIGDAIAAHYENNSIVPGHIPRDIIKYLIPRIEKDWRIVFQAHTHTQGKIPNDRKMCIETGALCNSFDYWRNGKIRGKGKLSSVGYAVADMVKGKVDINSCNFVFCEWEPYI